MLLAGFAPGVLAALLADPDMLAAKLAAALQMLADPAAAAAPAPSGACWPPAVVGLAEGLLRAAAGPGPARAFKRS